MSYGLRIPLHLGLSFRLLEQSTPSTFTVVSLDPRANHILAPEFRVSPRDSHAAILEINFRTFAKT